MSKSLTEKHQGNVSRSRTRSSRSMMRMRLLPNRTSDQCLTTGYIWDQLHTSRYSAGKHSRHWAGKHFIKPLPKTLMKTFKSLAWCKYLFWGGICSELNFGPLSNISLSINSVHLGNSKNIDLQKTLTKNLKINFLTCDLDLKVTEKNGCCAIKTLNWYQTSAWISIKLIQWPRK